MKFLKSMVVSIVVLLFCLAGVAVPIAAFVAPIDYFVKKRVPFTGRCRDGYEAVTGTVYYSGLGMGSRMLGLYGEVTSHRCVRSIPSNGK